MKILADLYRAAERLQNAPMRDWNAFADDAARTQNAGFALYRAVFSAGGRVPDSVSFIASSDTDATRAYHESRIWRHNVVPESELAPLEPARRTDLIDDDEFVQLGPLYAFMERHGMFYQILVPAVLPDGSFLGMYLWRDRAGGDFDDLEKQRLALFMRHLVVVFGMSDFDGAPSRQDKAQAAAVAGQRDAVARFAERWGLTPAESRVLADLLEGLSLRQIAERSGRSYGTVRWHVRNILDKCHVGSQKDLLRAFYRLIVH